MAHSIQKYNGKMQIFSDSHLFIIVGFGIKIIRNSPSLKHFRHLAEQWQKALDLYGPGTMI
jgi:hypothetical protein